MTHVSLQVRMFACLLGGSFVTMGVARAGEPVPAIDSAAYCDEVTKFADNSLIKQECLDSEAKAERHFWTLWVGTPKEVRAECVSDLALSTPSYQGLSTCITGMMNLMRKGREVKAPPR
ncbi:hypothetical protein ACRAWG_27915 [Methylobacterium sp. P31]